MTDMAPPNSPQSHDAARIRELEDRAAALVEYGNSLPDGVTTEAFAEAANLRREARELRQGSGSNLGLGASEAKDSSSAAYSPDPHGFDLPDAPVVLRGYSVACPLCHRRVVTTEAPCECGFRFPRGYGEPLDVEARDIGTGDSLDSAIVELWRGRSLVSSVTAARLTREQADAILVALGEMPSDA